MDRDATSHVAVGIESGAFASALGINAAGCGAGCDEFRDAAVEAA